MGDFNVYGEVAATTGTPTMDTLCTKAFQPGARVALRNTIFTVESAGYGRFLIQAIDSTGIVIAQFQTAIRDAVAGFAKFEEDLQMEFSSPLAVTLVVGVISGFPAAVATATISGRAA